VGRGPARGRGRPHRHPLQGVRVQVDNICRHNGKARRECAHDTPQDGPIAQLRRNVSQNGHFASLPQPPFWMLLRLLLSLMLSLMLSFLIVCFHKDVVQGRRTHLYHTFSPFSLLGELSFATVLFPLATQRRRQSSIDIDIDIDIGIGIGISGAGGGGGTMGRGVQFVRDDHVGIGIEIGSTAVDRGLSYGYCYLGI
jgi:hypothetical protein